MPDQWHEWVGCAVIGAYLIGSIAYAVYALLNPNEEYRP